MRSLWCWLFGHDESLPIFDDPRGHVVFGLCPRCFRAVPWKKPATDHDHACPGERSGLCPNPYTHWTVDELVSGVRGGGVGGGQE